jgi:hypothetical protein
MLWSVTSIVIACIPNGETTIYLTFAESIKSDRPVASGCPTHEKQGLQKDGCSFDCGKIHDV